MAAVFSSLMLTHPTQMESNRQTRSTRFSVSASTVEKNARLSWGESSELNASDAYNGWAVVEKPEFKEKEKGASVAALIGAVAAYFSVSAKGFKFQFSSPFNSSQGILAPHTREEEAIEQEAVSSDELLEVDEAFEVSPESVSDTFDKNVVADPNNITIQGELHRIIIPFAVDSTQQDALLVLKKLKIIEDDVKAEELCTRREYARWLVQASALLERNRKHRIASSLALAGSTSAAFDDVCIEDPDFMPIQSLAEAGIIPSKLSLEKLPSNPYDSGDDKGVKFFPDRSISRQDLISWKAKLEYDIIPGINEEISRRKIGFLDVRDITSEVLVDLFVDILANERSIVWKVFGQSKRFQPNKPCTKGQVAVALTSGKMAEYTQSELAKMETENSSRLATMEEIKSDILERGDVQRFWQRKIDEEKNRGLEVNKAYLDAIKDLDQEKVVLENAQAELLKQKAALDCQKQLLSSLKEEVDEMSNTLASEQAIYMEEQSELQGVLSDLQVKYEGLLDTKSVLEAEIEALRILRSWVEDEGKKSQARAKVLEEAGRRWKWEKE
nr:Myosin-4 like [Ipomoea batatas]